MAPDRALVTTLEISGNRRITPEELVGRVDLPAGTFLGGIDVHAVELRVQAHPWIASARVTALPPGRLLIGVEERTARAAAPFDGRLHYVDGSGIAFAPAPSRPGVPELVGAEDVALDVPNAALVAGIQILDSLDREGLPAPARIVVADAGSGEHPSFEWIRGEKTQRILVGQGQVADKVRRLGRLIRHRLPEVAQATSLDLRFAERAILRAPEEPSPEDEVTAATPAGREGRGA